MLAPELLELLDVLILVLLDALLLLDPDASLERDAPSDAETLNDSDSQSDDVDAPPVPAPALRESGSDSESENDVGTPTLTLVGSSVLGLPVRESAPRDCEVRASAVDDGWVEGSGVDDSCCCGAEEASEVCRGCDSEEAVVLGGSDVVLGASVVRTCAWDVVVNVVGPELVGSVDGEVLGELVSDVEPGDPVLVWPTWVDEVGEPGLLVESTSDVPTCTLPDELPPPSACLAMTRRGAWGDSNATLALISRASAAWTHAAAAA